jgi:septation ring formation regulator EzrA
MDQSNLGVEQRLMAVEASQAGLHGSLQSVDTRLHKVETDVAVIRSNYATKEDLANFRTEMVGKFADVDAWLAEMRRQSDAQFARVDVKFAEVKAAFSGVAAEFSGVGVQFAAVDVKFARVDTQLADIRADIARLETRMVRWIMATLITVCTLNIGLTLALFKLLR